MRQQRLPFTLAPQHSLLLSCWLACTACYHIADAAEPEAVAEAGAHAATDGRGTDAALASSDDDSPAGAGRASTDEPAAAASDNYAPCSTDIETCGDPNMNCVAYVKDPASMFCAPFCTGDDVCPALSGWSAACNFAWCALLCNAGVCPEGMTCIRSVTFLDATGADRGVKDVCVIAP